MEKKERELHSAITRHDNLHKEVDMIISYGTQKKISKKGVILKESVKKCDRSEEEVIVLETTAKLDQSTTDYKVGESKA